MGGGFIVSGRSQYPPNVQIADFFQRNQVADPVRLRI